MFGASVTELYLLIKVLINTERTVDLCVITKRKKNTRVQRNCVSQAWRGQTLVPVHRVN